MVDRIITIACEGWSVDEHQEDDGSWSIVSTALPGLVVGADTREQAWAMWPEVVELWASTANDERVKAELSEMGLLSALVLAFVAHRMNDWPRVHTCDEICMVDIARRQKRLLNERRSA